MKIFTFDKFWNLIWAPLGNNTYSCEYFDFYVVADKAIAAHPTFSISHVDNDVKTLLIKNLDSDGLIMQLRSIKETNKILTN